MNKSPDPVSAGIADTIRAEAARAHVSLNNIASIIGRSQAYVYGRLAGRGSFTVEDINKIAEALHMSLSTFFDSYQIGERVHASDTCHERINISTTKK